MKHLRSVPRPGDGSPSKATDVSTRIHCVDPGTGQRLGEVSSTPVAALPEIVAKVRESQAWWARTPFATRRAVLGRLLDGLLDQADELIEYAVRDAGKTRDNAVMGEIWTVAEKLRWTMRHGERWLRPERRGAGLLAYKRARVEYEPLGVVGVICPWNYPLQNVLGPVIPAIMAGNGAVVKVSEHVAWSGARFQRLLDEAFESCGLAPGLVRLVQGGGDVGAGLIGAGVDLVVFTGSRANGQRVLAAAAEPLVPAVLELGGKDPLIVCADADVERAVQGALTGAFIAAGQNCLAAERMLVCEAVYDRFERGLVRAAAALRVGPPRGEAGVDVGALTNELQLARVEELVADAVALGAEVKVGGRRAAGPGFFFEPTVLAGVTPQMRIFREETFGPVACLVRVRDEEHAIALANDCEYGLGATVFTRSRETAARITAALRVGCVSVNDFALTYMAQSLPFGGVGGSGFGRLNGPEGLRAMTNVKAVMEDRWPLAPTASIYPTTSTRHALVREGLRLVYGRGVARKARALRALVRAVRAERSE